METGVGVGERIARLRKLAGWAQHQMAARAFVSTSLVKKVEQGRTPPSAAFVASCARALGVEVRELYGVQVTDTVSELHSETADISELREALHSFDDPRPSGSALSPTAIRTRLDRAERHRREQRYAQLALLLPQTLQHLFILVDDTSPATEAGERARAMLHDAYRLTASVGGRFGHPDLAATASERHHVLAPSTGDPLRAAVSAWHRSSHFLQNGHYAAGLRLLDRALRRAAEQTKSNDAWGVAAQLHFACERDGRTKRRPEHRRRSHRRGSRPG